MPKLSCPTVCASVSEHTGSTDSNFKNAQIQFWVCLSVRLLSHTQKRILSRFEKSKAFIEPFLARPARAGADRSQ